MQISSSGRKSTSLKENSSR